MPLLLRLRRRCHVALGEKLHRPLYSRSHLALPLSSELRYMTIITAGRQCADLHDGDAMTTAAPNVAAEPRQQPKRQMP